MEFTINMLMAFQYRQEAVSTAAERYLLIYMIAVIFIISALFILFFIVFQKRKNKLLIEKMEQQQAFEEEITLAQTEIQEQTLKNIGWELHDNVGQLLAVANMQLSILSTQVADDMKEKVKEASGVLKESLREVRSLSKSLNHEVVLNMGFEKSISNELDRLKKMKFASAELQIKGEKQNFENRKHEIIIFRILQEFFSNSVKYSEADNLEVVLEYLANSIHITASDDGKGFDIENVEKGSGLINMKSRAALINATLHLESTPNQGVQLNLKYPLANLS